MVTRRTNGAPGGVEQRVFTLFVRGARKQRRKGTVCAQRKLTVRTGGFRTLGTFIMEVPLCVQGVYDGAHSQVSTPLESAMPSRIWKHPLVALIFVSGALLPTVVAAQGRPGPGATSGGPQ